MNDIRAASKNPAPLTADDRITNQLVNAINTELEQST
jgi:hypothetical protein